MTPLMMQISYVSVSNVYERRVYGQKYKIINAHLLPVCREGLGTV
jgi:hypothetical protein